MAGEIEGLVTFGDNGVEDPAVEPTELGGGDDAATRDTGVSEGSTTRNTREWPSDGTRPRGPDGKFQGEPGAPAKKEAPKPAAPPATPPARLKLRVPKEDGSGHDELEMTPEEAGQRLAEARKLTATRQQEQAARAQADKETAGVLRFVKDIKAGASRDQALLGLMRATGMSEEDCEDTLALALHGYVKSATEDAELTPDQRRIRELEAREAAREEETHRQTADAQSRVFEQQVRERGEVLAGTLGEALKKSGLPASPELLADMGRHYLFNKKAGLTLTADELASYASENLDRNLGARLKDLPAEEFSKRFPDAAKAWGERLEAMDAADFLKAHPKLGPKLLRHFREVARTKGQAPAVGATRPAPRAVPRQQDEERPRFYDPHDPASFATSR